MMHFHFTDKKKSDWIIENGLGFVGMVSDRPAMVFEDGAGRIIPAGRLILKGYTMKHDNIDFLFGEVTDPFAIEHGVYQQVDMTELFNMIGGE